MTNLNSQTVLQQEAIVSQSLEREGKSAQLTISYRSSFDGQRLAGDYVADLRPGEVFSIISPRFQDLYTDDIVVEGTMPEDGHDLSLVVFYEEKLNLWERFQQSKYFKPVILAAAAMLCVVSMRSPWSLGNILQHFSPAETVVEEAPVREVPVDDAQEHILSISYVFEGGSPALPNYVARCAEGSAYRVISPAIAGYAPSKTVVTGCMPDSDYTDTVVYHSTTSVLSDPAYIGNAPISGGMNVEDIPEHAPKTDFQPKAPYIDEEPHKVDPGDTPIKGDPNLRYPGFQPQDPSADSSADHGYGRQPELNDYPNR